jgi:hypothetical protein
VHTWDIAVALDPLASIGPEALDLVLDGIGRVVGFAGKSQGLDALVRVNTTDPERTFTLTMGERTSLEAGSSAAETASMILPAEAFIRLVYGRLDAAHTPPMTVTGIDIDDLRRAFPGF